eukprot:g5998.t1
MDSDSEDSTTPLDVEEKPLIKDESTVTSNVPLGRGVKLAICVSHALSAWSERTWSFAVALIFLAIHEDSLFFVSVFGLVQSLGSIIFSPSVGLYIDKTPRLKAVCVLLFVQNLALVLSALASLMLLAFHDDPSSPLGISASIGVILCGVFTRVGAMGSTIAIEKDWTKALTGGNSLELAKLNSTLKTIDLSCSILAPILSGVLMSVFNTTIAVVQILVYNLIVWFPQVALLQFAYTRAPQLHLKAAKETPKETPKAVWWQRWFQYLNSLKNSFGLYIQQSSVLAAMSLAILHLTVLSFGVLMTAYVKWLGLTEAILSLYRGFGALTGVLGAKAFPYIHKRLGLFKTGFLAIVFQLTCVILGAGPDVGNHLFLSISAEIRFHLLVWGIALSRFGLWVFDLSVSQIIQEWVSDDHLGQVCGVQKLIENFFQLCMFVGGIIAPHPQEFVWLMLISMSAVTTSFLLFTFFISTHQKHYTTPQEIEMTNENIT